MDTIATVCERLGEKKALFLAYEKATQGLLECDADSAEQYITERERLAIEIDAKDAEITGAAQKLPQAQLLLDAAAARIDFEKVPAEFQSVFYAGQEVRAVIRRTVECDRKAVAHLEGLRVRALDNVKHNKEIPKIKRYLTDLSTQPQTGALRNRKV